MAVWPTEEDITNGIEPYFFLERLPGMVVSSVKQVRENFPSLGLIPILSPLEHTELVLEPKYVRQNIAGRLSSRHFRNQLHTLQHDGSLDAFLLWCEQWHGEIEIESLSQDVGDGGMQLHVFYKEPGSRIPKELVWAGDGIQIWLQLLYHVYRVRNQDTIILDEPEVYLHPDLQRRLVHLLESTGRQIILATHSAEVIAEADSRHIAMVEKSRRTARRPKSEADLELLSEMLGTAFNVRLARALRSRVAVFVEGQDMTVLRRFAKTLGCTSLEREQNVTVIPLKGYSRWGQVEPFAWLLDEMLPDAIKVCVILDRDYRTDSQVSDVLSTFSARGIEAHVWHHKELESYVLTTSVIARRTGKDPAAIDAWIDEITDEMSHEVFSRLVHEKIRTEKSATNHEVSIMTAFRGEFETAWKSADYRRRTAPPKKVISELNSRLQGEGLPTISSAGLARAHHVGEISHEVSTLLKGVEARI